MHFCKALCRVNASELSLETSQPPGSSDQTVDVAERLPSAPDAAEEGNYFCIANPHKTNATGTAGRVNIAQQLSVEAASQ